MNIIITVEPPLTDTSRKQTPLVSGHLPLADTNCRPGDFFSQTLHF